MHSLRALVVTSLLIPWLAACGGGSGEAEPAAPASSPPAVASPVMGSFQIGETSYEFRVSRCDLTGSSPDGILLRGGGTLSDGRTFGVEVERLTPDMGGPGWPYERATVTFGSFMDEDGWESTAMTMDGSRWTDGNGAQVIDGPIIQVSGNDLSVAATYKHASRDEQLAGALHVTCPGPTYP